LMTVSSRVETSAALATETSRSTAIALTLNGQPREVEINPRWTLADALREGARMTSVHLGCEHGVCGACTVLFDGEPVRSCLMLALQAEGHAVETVEGGGDLVRRLQDAFRSEHALQCGFCTPGFLMLAAGLLATEPDASEDRITEVLSSNLCRCTGGLPIVRAVLAAQAS
jgi:aerobic carbon-monoxide dehydrogenase small subunit